MNSWFLININKTGYVCGASKFTETSEEKVVKPG